MKIAASLFVAAAAVTMASASTATKKKRRATKKNQRQRKAQVTTSCLGPDFETAFSGSCSYADVSAALTAKIQTDCNATVVVADELTYLLGTEGDVATACAAAQSAAESDQAVFLKWDHVTGMGDMHDKEFFDGGTFWNERVETADGQHVLSDDASRLLAAHTAAQGMGVAWPTSTALTNLADCAGGVVECCFVADRQSSDAGGTCDGPMCTESEPDGNADVCYVDMSRAPTSSRVPTGVAVYDRDTEGAAYCEGFAWDVNDDSSVGSRYKGNALVDVLKRNFYDKGYVYNVPGAPMCACVEQMPVVSEAACTQVSSVDETWTISSSPDGGRAALSLASVDSVTYDNTCNEKDLAAHVTSIDGNSDIASYLVGDGGCQGAIDAFLAESSGLKRSTLSIAGIKGHPAGDKVSVTFSSEVADSAADVNNYSIGGLQVLSAELDEDHRTVHFNTVAQTAGATHTLEVVGTGVVKRIASMVSVPSGTTATFEAASYGYEANVPESANYTVLYSLDIPENANWNTNPVPYVTYNYNHTVGTFSRVAYFMELESEEYHHEWMWVSMDAFTQNANRIAVPTFSSGAVFQEPVNNLNILTNDYEAVPGGELTGVDGNIEFWPNDYSKGNAKGVEGASGTAFDFGDTRASGGSYGSMQVHVASIQTTLFAMNNWNRNRDGVDAGIGNAPFGEPDWTFAARQSNAPTYSLKKLHVLVLENDDAADAALRKPSDAIQAAVPEASDGYEIVYDLDIPDKAAFSGSGAVPYDADFSLFVPPLERIAYYVELDSPNYGSQWVWASMDAFTDDARKIGVPTFASGAIFQQGVTGLNVFSNVDGMNGTDLTGNVEFWPNNYGTSNTASVPGASSSRFDYGDMRSTGGTYGSMQVHAPSLPANAKTLFALNDWNRNVNPCVGIGVNTVGEPDWTFTNNGLIYTTKRIQVFVK